MNSLAGFLFILFYPFTSTHRILKGIMCEHIYLQENEAIDKQMASRYIKHDLKMYKCSKCSKFQAVISIK